MHFLSDGFHALIKGVHGQILLLIVNCQLDRKQCYNYHSITTTHQRLRFPIQSLLHQLDDVLFCFNGRSKVLFTYTTIAVDTTNVS